MNGTKQLLAQPQFEVLSVPWDGKIQHSVADWRVNWFKLCTSEAKCYSSQDQDGLKLDISAGKCKFWILKTSFISSSIKNHLALFSPPVNCCKFVSTIFIYHKGLCSASRLPWGILIPTHVMVLWCNFKVLKPWGFLEHSRKTCSWLNKTLQISQILVPWANTLFVFLLFPFKVGFEGSNTMSGFNLWEAKVLHVLADLKIFLSAEGIDLEFQVSRAVHVPHASSVKAFVIETIMAIWSNTCFNTTWMTEAVGKYFLHLQQWPTG